ncbi:MAG: hypothetical protein SPI49_02135 [Eubacteriales bacterium]|nr:hypothetical protein [Anaerovoracaceae bacterium]MDY6072877.1 hypothetical protein [Eubacteriales bacterium]
MSNLQHAFNSWTESLTKVYGIISISPQNWNPDVWAVVKTINAGLTATAASLLVMFFFIGYLKQASNLKEIKKLENVLSLLIRLAIAIGLVGASMDIMLWIFEIMQGILSTIFQSSSAVFNMTVPGKIEDALKDVDFLSTEGIEIAIIGLILRLTVFVISIILIVIVWGRFLNLYLHFAVAGCFLSTFASESTVHIGMAFLKSFVNVCFQAAIITLALVIYSKLISSNNSQAIELIKNGDIANGLLTYSKDFFVGALVTLALCKQGEQIASKMGL